MIRTSDDVDEISAALSKAQGAMDDAPKDTTGQVGQQKTRYADLASVRAASRQALAANGLAYVQFPTAAERGYATIVTRLMHSSGQWIEDDAGVTVPAGNTAQTLGSAITYARRYSLMAVLGIAADDDDGHAATQARQQPRPKQQDTPAPRQPVSSEPAQDDGFFAITGPQLTKLGVMFGNVGIKDRDSRLALMRTLTGRNLTSSKDMTAAEASTAIGALTDVEQGRATLSVDRDGNPVIEAQS